MARMGRSAEGGQGLKTTKAQIKAVAKYDATHTVQFKVKLNKETDADIIAKLESVENKQGYVKGLIRQDIKSGRG